MKSISPVQVKVLLEHLLKFGEINPAETKELKVQDQITFLKNLNYIFCQEGVCSVNNNFLDLLPVDNINELLRKIFFSFPDYRKYLLAIVTENITKNGLEGAISNVETILLHFSKTCLQIPTAFKYIN